MYLIVLIINFVYIPSGSIVPSLFDPGGIDHILFLFCMILVVYRAYIIFVLYVSILIIYYFWS